MYITPLLKKGHLRQKDTFNVLKCPLLRGFTVTFFMCIYIFLLDEFPVLLGNGGNLALGRFRSLSHLLAVSLQLLPLWEPIHTTNDRSFPLISPPTSVL